MLPGFLVFLPRRAPFGFLDTIQGVQVHVRPGPVMGVLYFHVRSA